MTSTAEARRALLAARLRQRAAAGTFEHPMSLGQQALWFLHQGAPESSAYTMAFATRFRGALDVAALRRALEKLLHRHASLRTTFPMRDGQPRARVASWQALAWEEMDCPSPSEDLGSSATLAATLQTAVTKPFDLEVGPLFRATLFRATLFRAAPVGVSEGADGGDGADGDVRGGDRVLLLTVHHIVADGWSLAILLDELGRFYSAEASGSSAQLSAPEPGFDAFVRWQDEAISGDAGERAWRFWQHHLTAPNEPSLPMLDVPTDRRRPRERAMVGGDMPIDLEPTVAARLRVVARDQGITMFALLLAAYQAFLHRWSGQRSILVGTPAAARGDGRWQSLVGYCTNPIVLRGDLTDDPSFAAFARRVAGAVRRGLEHQGFPFPLLVKRLVPQRDLARSPVFQAFFVYKREGELGGTQDADAPDTSARDTGPDASSGDRGAQVGWGGLRTERVPVSQLSGQFEVTLDAVVSDQGLEATLLYDRELFLPATAARMAAAFGSFLAEVAATPDTCVSALPLAPTDSLVRPMSAGDELRSKIDSVAVTSVDGHLAEWARRAPEASALGASPRDEHAPATDADDGLTYGALEARVGRLAAALRRRGIVDGSRETVVGVAVERSPAMVVALLAILRAGGTYLPIDPSFPAQRMAWMLEDAGAAHVLVDAAGQAALPPAHRDRAMLIDDVASVGLASVGLARGSFETLAPRSRPAEAAAYVLYTSGSTGRPKGVVVSHGALAGFLDAMQAELALATDDRWLAVTTVSFDIAGLELFLPLITGGELVVAPDADSQDGERLARLLAARAITVLQATPATWRLLLASGWAGQPGLRMLCGGEAMPEDLASTLAAKQAGDGAGLWNLYGPTEATIWSSAYRVDTGRTMNTGSTMGIDAPSVAIGLPLANTVLAIVDRDLRPMPPGAFGELAIGGTGVARGYCGQPARTAERFVPDPFSDRPGARLYRTGDRVHQRPDGRLAFHGRGDQQIKLRGFRIELGEIETALRDHPAVRDAAVLLTQPGRPGGEPAQADRTQDGQLVACLVHGATDAPASTEALREHLGTRLPRYMLPARFVSIDRLPRTPNGKLDRGALAALPAVGAAVGSGRRAASRPATTATEKKLATIWQAVLAVETIGADDDFFADVGGHSLLAAQILARIRQEIGVDLPLRVLFEAPTVARLAQRIDGEATDEQPPENSAREGAGDTASVDRSEAAVPPLVAMPRDQAARGGSLPISFAQERLWFLEQYEPESAFYAMPVALRFVGRLEVDALRMALDQLVSRHEALRTVFHTVDGRPRPSIVSSAPVALPVDDLTEPDSNEAPAPGALLAGERRETVNARLRADVARPFDLTQAPLLRARLLRLGAQDHVLLVTVHHIASDGWSTQVMVREVAALYRAALGLAALPEAPGDGVPRSVPALPALPLQYVDYAAWQRRLLTGPRLATDIAYWRRQLAGVPALELPTDRPRPAEQRFRGRTLRFEVPNHVKEALAAVGQEQGATLFMSLLAGFQALLARLSGQHDFCVGTPVANRPRVALEGMIGFFVNMLPLRADLADDPSFAQLVARSRDVVLAAHAHQRLPFERLVDELDLPRDLSRSPLFQVALILHPQPRRPVALPGLAVEPVALDTGTAKFDLTLALTEDDAGLRGELEVASDLFSEATSRRFVQQLQRLLIAAAIRPELPISRLSLLAADERVRLLERWNETGRTIPSLAVHRQIAAQAARAPERVAVCFGDRHLTYGDLWRQTQALADTLRAHGVGPEVMVGICLERSMTMLVAVLAVLEAGGAYLPLDPGYPAARLRLLVEDAGPHCLVSTESLAARLPRSGTIVVPGEPSLAGQSAAAAKPGAGEHAAPDPLQAAYILHTSGSTGRPKGVVVPHAALANFLASMAERPGLGAEDTLLAVTSLSFDISALELLLPLTVGARLVLAGREPRTDGHALRGLIDRHQPTAMQATPATWRLLLATGWTGRRGMAVLCGGEALPRQLADDLAERADRVWNLYGPTETTVWSAVHAIAGARAGMADADEGSEAGLDRGPDRSPDRGRQRARFEHGTERSDPVAIGRPIANTRLYVLDTALEPVSVGVPGELYIGGDGVTRGYYARPGATAERFVPDPYRQGMRLYRTGDRVRYRADGSLLFIDRLDRQVKVRGFRVELGEVETAVRRHPAVAEAAVVCLDDASGGHQLVACLRLEADGASLSADQESTLQGEQVTAWRSLWSEAYRGAAQAPGFDTSGWHSSFTGQPIPVAQMRLWRDERVARILALEGASAGAEKGGGRRMWEIGCGTGLLTSRLVPHAGHYLATDVSPAAIARLERNLQGLAADPPASASPSFAGLGLAARPADDFTGIAPASFDTVIINSVVQYFPDFAYFERVLAGALAAVAPGGTVFLGDLRSLPLLETFHLAAITGADGAADDSDETTTAGALHSRLEVALAGEEELLIDPAYFTGLAMRWPTVAGCEVLVQRTGDQEMSRYRYDVVVYRAPDVAVGSQPVAIGLSVPWDAVGALDGLRTRLTAHRNAPGCVELLGVPNRRVAGDVARLQKLRYESDDDAVVPAAEVLGVDPGRLWEIGEAVGYRVRVRWSQPGGRSQALGAVDALFVPREVAALPGAWRPWPEREKGVGSREGVESSADISAAPSSVQPWTHQPWANQPLRASRERRLLPAVRAFVGERLPSHAVPSTWMRLDRLPLTPNGKIDRKALARQAQQDPAGPGAAGGRRVPTSALEEQVAAIWCDVLRRDLVSLDDNFFEIGGHSLLAAHAHGRLQEAGFALEVIDLFRHPTLAGLVAFLGPAATRSEQGSAPDAVVAGAGTAVVGTAPSSSLEPSARPSTVSSKAPRQAPATDDAAAGRARQRLGRRTSLADRRRARQGVRSRPGRPAPTTPVASAVPTLAREPRPSEVAVDESPTRDAATTETGRESGR